MVSNFKLLEIADLTQLYIKCMENCNKFIDSYIDVFIVEINSSPYTDNNRKKIINYIYKCYCTNNKLYYDENDEDNLTKLDTMEEKKKLKSFILIDKNIRKEILFNKKIFLEKILEED